MTERQLMEMPRYETSDAFDDVQRAAIDFAVAMTKAPTEIPQQLMVRLHAHFDDAQLVELASAIAWENYRARFNRAFGVQSAGYCEGAFCAMPERVM